MAETVFLLGRQFGRGAPAFRHEEQRVIAEALVSGLVGQDAALPDPLRDQGSWIVLASEVDQNAAKSRTAIFFGHAGQRVQ